MRQKEGEPLHCAAKGVVSYHYDVCLCTWNEVDGCKSRGPGRFREKGSERLVSGKRGEEKRK